MRTWKNPILILCHPTHSCENSTRRCTQLHLLSRLFGRFKSQAIFRSPSFSVLSRWTRNIISVDDVSTFLHRYLWSPVKSINLKRKQNRNNLNSCKSRSCLWWKLRFRLCSARFVLLRVRLRRVQTELEHRPPLKGGGQTVTTALVWAAISVRRVLFLGLLIDSFKVLKSNELHAKDQRPQKGYLWVDVGAFPLCEHSVWSTTLRS